MEPSFDSWSQTSLPRWETLAGEFEEAWHSGDAAQITDYFPPDFAKSRLYRSNDILRATAESYFKALLETELFQKARHGTTIRLSDYFKDYPSKWVIEVFWQNPAGVIVADYRIDKELGRGGMGAVFRAQHLTLGKTVALKIMRPDLLEEHERDVRERFRREASIIGSIEHPHIVRAFDARDEHGLLILAMELLEGCNLGELIEQKQALPREVAVDYTIQACKGMAAAHERGVVHRDLKPWNMMLTDSGTVKVLDLGLAFEQPKATEIRTSERLTQQDQSFGTPDFAAPEQLAGVRDVDGRADIYSMGCTLFYLLTAEMPPGAFDSNDEERIRQLRRRFNNRQTSDVIAKCMQRDPADRYQSAPEMLQAVQGLMTNRGRRRFLAAGFAGLLVAGSAGTFARYRSDRNDLCLLGDFGGRWWFDVVPEFTPTIRRAMLDNVMPSLIWMKKTPDSLRSLTDRIHRDMPATTAKESQTHLLVAVHKNNEDTSGDTKDKPFQQLLEHFTANPVSASAEDTHLLAALKHTCGQTEAVADYEAAIEKYEANGSRLQYLARMDLARYHLTRDPTAAWNLLRSRVDDCPQRFQASWYALEADSLRYRQLPRKAFESFDKALQLTSDPSFRGFLQQRIGWLALQLWRLDEAVSHFEECDTVLSPSRDPYDVHNRAMAIQGIARVAYLRADEKCPELFNEALQHSHEWQLEREPNLHEQLADWYSFGAGDDSDKALENYRWAIQEAEHLRYAERGRARNLLRTQYKMVIAAARAGEIEVACETMQRAESIKEAQKLSATETAWFSAYRKVSQVLTELPRDQSADALHKIIHDFGSVSLTEKNIDALLVAIEELTLQPDPPPSAVVDLSAQFSKLDRVIKDNNTLSTSELSLSPHVRNYLARAVSRFEALAIDSNYGNRLQQLRKMLQ